MSSIISSGHILQSIASIDKKRLTKVIAKRNKRHRKFYARRLQLLTDLYAFSVQHKNISEVKTNYNENRRQGENSRYHRSVIFLPQYPYAKVNFQD
ncbi:hypothetical protein Ccrd_004274 [Cynara cardunculus var. scolymus]|uniref:Uncharacterized protein n=1 Tax=Cynara cardunculus var. scolymus TaxID=59895 RepID=A0A124SCG1_CYNCS|nr:hypothetical protein Ccrd_004274 [Cynara cardunculus var. scolymus]